MKQRTNDDDEHSKRDNISIRQERVFRYGGRSIPYEFFLSFQREHMIVNEDDETKHWPREDAIRSAK
jgi:hypothetical protein